MGRMISVMLGLGMFSDVHAGLWVGAAKVDITPPLPVALLGQMYERIATEVESPVTASVVVLERRGPGGDSLEHAVMVSCDLVAIPRNVQDAVRDRLMKLEIPGLDVSKVFLNATHTHSAPAMKGTFGGISIEGTEPEEYIGILAERIGRAIAEAWMHRQPGTVGWGMGHAVVAQNRRAVYLDGTAVMYGSVDRPEFRRIEAMEDHVVDTLFFWNQEGRPVAMAVNVACPAQEVEHRRAINADYWHEVRKSLGEKYGPDLVVLGWIGAAGDQSPHLMFRKAAEERMREARGLTRLEEIARRIVRAVDEAYEVASGDRRSDLPFIHQVRELRLPLRRVTEAEVEDAGKQIAKLREEAEATGKDRSIQISWYQNTVDRFEEQATPKAANVYSMELHAIRLGDIAIGTNPFELFTEFGIRMKARSKATQTFVIQLTGDFGSYLATEEAEAAGGYSAIIQSCRVGHRGGAQLVDETVNAINSFWAED